MPIVREENKIALETGKFIMELPREIRLLIFSALPLLDLCSFVAISKEWKRYLVTLKPS
jgi:hypothetical protein